MDQGRTPSTGVRRAARLDGGRRRSAQRRTGAGGRQRPRPHRSAEGPLRQGRALRPQAHQGPRPDGGRRQKDAGQGRAHGEVAHRGGGEGRTGRGGQGGTREEVGRRERRDRCHRQARGARTRPRHHRRTRHPGPRLHRCRNRRRQGRDDRRLQLLRRRVQRQLVLQAAPGPAARVRPDHPGEGGLPQDRAGRLGERRREGDGDRAGRRPEGRPRGPRPLRRRLLRPGQLRGHPAVGLLHLGGRRLHRRLHLELPAGGPAGPGGPVPEPVHRLLRAERRRPHRLHQQPAVLGRRGLRPPRRPTSSASYGTCDDDGQDEQVRPVLEVRQRLPRPQRQVHASWSRTTPTASGGPRATTATRRPCTRSTGARQRRQRRRVLDRHHRRRHPVRLRPEPAARLEHRQAPRPTPSGPSRSSATTPASPATTPATPSPTAPCTQAWRWNLDYVVDPHGNAMSYWYEQGDQLLRQERRPPATAPRTTAAATSSASTTASARDTLFSTTQPAAASVTFTDAERCVPASAARPAPR